MKITKPGLVLCLLAVAAVCCSGWGFLLHRTVNQLSVYQLPKQMEPFFYKNMAYLVKQSVRPDERRGSDPTEATKHFIDIEMYGPNAVNAMPMNWNDAVARYTKDSLLKYGYVPYWIIEMKGRLTRAFATANKDSILFYAADLAHYIADANVPLHTSVNYDGQLTNQKGLHALWESVVPELTLDSFNLQGKKKAKYLKNPEKAIWQAVRRAYALLPGVFDTETELTKQFTEATKYRVQMRNGREVKYYTTAFARAYAGKLLPSINAQATYSANLVADFWYTAWVDGGKPDLGKLLSGGFTAADKAALKAEHQAYKTNSLLKEKLLISKKDAVRDPSAN